MKSFNDYFVARGKFCPYIKGDCVKDRCVFFQLESSETGSMGNIFAICLRGHGNGKPGLPLGRILARIEGDIEIIKACDEKVKELEKKLLDSF